jgi:EAL domain-containing protein (putative c-di-GMP-specific phosphodiesterase class I)
MYRFFIQPQLNKVKGSLIGYELLLKQKTATGWRPPHHFADITPTELSTLLLETTKVLSLKIPSLAVNLNREQLIDPAINQALIKVQALLRPIKLNIELTEETTEPPISNRDIFPFITDFTDMGMKFVLDDVGSGLNQYKAVRTLLPYVSEVKFALQNFRHARREAEIAPQLKFWRQLTQHENIRLIIEGIETAADDQMADQLGIDLRQGYFYGKPRLLKIAGD